MKNKIWLYNNPEIDVNGISEFNRNLFKKFSPKLIADDTRRRHVQSIIEDMQTHIEELYEKLEQIK